MVYELSGPFGPASPQSTKIMGLRPKCNGSAARRTYLEKIDLAEKELVMNLSGIKEHMEVIGADGVHVGTVDRVEGDRIKLTRADGPIGATLHRFIAGALVAAIEQDRVRLSANGAVAALFEEEEQPDGLRSGADERIDEAELESFPASDPPAL